jgi:hypothetical protein
LILRHLIGEQIMLADDEINKYARSKRLSVCVLGHEAPANIDHDPHRLCVCLDKDSRIHRFYVG